jgi:aspartate aminotransferase
MLNETYRGMLAHKSVIRETFMYGKHRPRRGDRL